jgi:hypothetical protein
VGTRQFGYRVAFRDAGGEHCHGRSALILEGDAGAGECRLAAPADGVCNLPERTQLRYRQAAQPTLLA